MKSFGYAGVTLACSSVILLAGCNPGGPAASRDAGPAMDPDTVAAEVRAAIQTQVDAMASHDAARSTSVLAPGIVAMFHGEPNAVGKDAAMATTVAMMADPAIGLEVSDATVDVAASGDLAVYHATYHFTFTNPATQQPASEVGNWVAIFKRQPDGEMRMIKDVVVNLPASATAVP